MTVGLLATRLERKLAVIDHFTVASLVTWPLSSSEAGVDLDKDLAAFIMQIKLFLC